MNAVSDVNKTTGNVTKPHQSLTFVCICLLVSLQHLQLVQYINVSQLHVKFITATCMKYFYNISVCFTLYQQNHAVSDVTTSTSEITVDYCNQNYN